MRPWRRFPARGALGSGREGRRQGGGIGADPEMHAANIKRLQEWIALPSIAAENRNFPQGPEYMAKLAQDAGFTGVKLIPTSGKPGVFGKIDAGARTTMAHLFHVRREAVRAGGVELAAARGDGWCKRRASGTVCMGRGAVNQKGPENSFLSALMAFKAAGKKLPVNLVLVCEGEEEIASPHFHEVDKKSGSDGRTQKVRRHFHAGSRPGSRRRGAGVARRQGRGRTRIGFERREMGPRAGARCALEPRGASGFAHLAPGPGVEHPGRKRWPHAGRGRIFRKGQAAERGTRSR